MALFVSVGGFFTQQPGHPVTWYTTINNSSDRVIVIQAPNINDDLALGPVQLVVLNQSVAVSDTVGHLYLVTIQNPGPRPVTYNLNIQDPL